MELSRRDALVALAGGVAVGGASLAAFGGASESPNPDAVPPEVREALVAAAEVVYPSEVDGVETFVETYVAGRYDGDSSDYAADLRAAIAELDDAARDWYGDSFAALDVETRESLLRELGVDAADPDGDGSVSERLRRFVVNELLYALYTSPAGGRLVGVENPIGYPGGIESYQRASMDEP